MERIRCIWCQLVYQIDQVLKHLQSVFVTHIVSSIGLAIHILVDGSLRMILQTDSEGLIGTRNDLLDHLNTVDIKCAGNLQIGAFGTLYSLMMPRGGTVDQQLATGEHNSIYIGSDLCGIGFLVTVILQ